MSITKSMTFSHVVDQLWFSGLAVRSRGWFESAEMPVLIFGGKAIKFEQFLLGYSNDRRKKSGLIPEKPTHSLEKLTVKNSIMIMEEPILITTTVERQEHAEDIARVLLDKRLVACAQIHGPIKSMYWWKQDVAESVEFVLTLKTFATLYPEVEVTILAAHPYDVPEIIGQPMTKMSQSYLAWMRGEVAR